MKPLDLNLLLVFARVVEAGSFAAAARRLGSTRSAISKAVAKLEKSLDARLLNRSTRHLSLTDNGRELADRCARLLDDVEELEQLIGNLHDEPRGTLRVCASVAFGTLHVAPALAEFLASHSALKMELTLSDRQIDLAAEGYDMAIRVTAEPPLSLVARRIAPIRRQLCATPDYFDRHGLPLTPADLAQHNCLDYTRSGEDGHWRFHGPHGDIRVAVSGSLRVDDDEALSQAVLGGLGIGLLPTFIIGQQLQSGHLKAVLSEYLPIERHVYALYLPTRHLPAKVRYFIDFLLQRIGSEPYWDQTMAQESTEEPSATVAGQGAHCSRDISRG